jgi:hypothetical protein
MDWTTGTGKGQQGAIEGLHWAGQEVSMFSVEYRNRVRDRVLDHAASDPRFVAGAIVGSLALDQGDRWSDLDLTFAVVDGVPVLQVLDDWTRRLVAEFDAVHLFDQPSGASLYRVFLFPGCLQVDISCTPAAAFGATSPRFKLLFGQAVDKPHLQPPSAEHLFGDAVHLAVRARICLERGRPWQAEYLISWVRDIALSLACRRRGLAGVYSRGVDDLPADVRAAFDDTLVRSLEPDELQRALGRTIAALLREAGDVPALAASVEPHLRELVLPWDA